ncbi:ABC transporter substrate-binding protein [bacterium]|nr:ABC transporter substrate-binding protein [bacterium]
MKKLVFLGFVFCALTFAAEQSTVVVGLASNFSEVSTGSSNPYGGYFKDGVTLALKHSEAKLRARGIKITTQEFDYGTSDIKVLEATRKAIASPAIAILGYNYSSNALLAAPLHHEAKLPMLTPSATANRLGSFGRYIHMASFSNAFMGETLARVAKSKLNASKAVVLPAANCAYCSDLAESFSSHFQKLGGSVVVNLPILNDDTVFSDVIEKLKLQKFDVVFIPNQELTSARLIAALSKAGVKVPFMGADGWGNVGQEFFGILNDAKFSGFSTSHWHPDLKDKASLDFIASYKASFGKMPNDTSVLAYDSMLLLVEALLKSKTLDREGVENALNQMTSFKGVTGKFVMTANQPPRKSLVLLKTNNKKFQIVDSISPQTKGAL